MASLDRNRSAAAVSRSERYRLSSVHRNVDACGDPHDPAWTFHQRAGARDHQSLSPVRLVFVSLGPSRMGRSSRSAGVPFRFETWRFIQRLDRHARG